MPDTRDTSPRPVRHRGARRRAGLRVAAATLLLALAPPGPAGLPQAGAVSNDTASMGVPRTDFTMARLPDGSVLAAGGVSDRRWGLASAEVFHPDTGRWTRTGPLTTGRYDTADAVLDDGRVLAAGGVDHDHEALASVEIYDPSSGTWDVAAPMGVSRVDATATTLPDGRVLVAGGYGPSDGLHDGGRRSSEVYDPDTDTWTRTGSMTEARELHVAVALRDGTVLVLGGFRDRPGYLATAEVYDPDTGSWTATGSMAHRRGNHQAAVLPDGRVLVVGGNGNDGRAVDSTEVYDPSLGAWRPAGSMGARRSGHALVGLDDGRVLAIGGMNRATAEAFDPVTEQWQALDPLGVVRWNSSAALLPDGSVLVAGGDPAPGVTASAEILTSPVVHTRTVTLTAAHRTVSGVQRLVLSGGVSVADGTTACTTGRRVTLSRFDPPTDRWVELATPTTTSGGTFRARTSDRHGRYRVDLGREEVFPDGGTLGCGEAATERTHLH